MSKIAVHHIGDDRELIRQQILMSIDEFTKTLGWTHPSIEEGSNWYFEGVRESCESSKHIESPTNTVFSDELLGCATIEFNVTDLCNRRCWMCPHSNEELFPNRPDMMQLSTVQNVVDSLKDTGYVNGFTFGSWGEPFLNPNIIEMVSYVSENLPGNSITLYSNGDRLLKGSIPGYGAIDVHDIIDSGLTQLDIDIYDNDEKCIEVLNKLKPLIGTVNLAVHRRYTQGDHPNFVTRAGLMDPYTGEKPTDEVRQANKRRAYKIKRCYAPLTGAFIDVDGSWRACCHEWGRELPIGGNVNDTPFLELWRNSESMNELRKTLLTQRTLISPCDQCDAAGGTRSPSGHRAQKLWKPILEEEQ